eukprot:3616891-Pleurochrysis_carterae.AAC.4
MQTASQEQVRDLKGHAQRTNVEGEAVGRPDNSLDCSNSQKVDTRRCTTHSSDCFVSRLWDWHVTRIVAEANKRTACKGRSPRARRERRQGETRGLGIGGKRTLRAAALRARATCARNRRSGRAGQAQKERMFAGAGCGVRSDCLLRHVGQGRVASEIFWRGAACVTSGKALWLSRCRGNSTASDAPFYRVAASALVQAALTEMLFRTARRHGVDKGDIRCTSGAVNGFWVRGGYFRGAASAGPPPAAASRARARVGARLSPSEAPALL